MRQPNIHAEKWLRVERAEQAFGTGRKIYSTNGIIWLSPSQAPGNAPIALLHAEMYVIRLHRRAMS